MVDTILVIGGTGMLGEPVARRLQADGYCIRILTRTPEKARARFKAGYEIVGGDVEAPYTLANAMRGCQGVHINLHGGATPDLERRGTINVVQAALRAGVSRLTYLSGASVIEENCWFADTKARYEAETAIQSSGVPYTLFKASWFMESLHKFVHGQRAFVFGRQPKRWHWVAAEDYTRMVSKAYTTPAATNKRLFIYGPQLYTMREAMEQFMAIVHPDTHLIPMPFWVAAIIACLGQRSELQAALPFFRYCERVSVHEAGDPAEANALLGAPTMTLEQWSRQRVT